MSDLKFTISGVTSFLPDNRSRLKKYIYSGMYAAHKMKFSIKGALAGLKHFLATESPFKMMKNTFYFNLKSVFVLKIFNFLSGLFGRKEKRFDSKDKVHFKIDDMTSCETKQL